MVFHFHMAWVWKTKGIWWLTGTNHYLLRIWLFVVVRFRISIVPCLSYVFYWVFFFFWTNTLLSFLQVKSNLLQAVQFLLAFRERMNAGNPDAKAGSTTTEANLQVDPIQVSYRFSIILRILASLKWLMLLLIRWENQTKPKRFNKFRKPN